MCCRFYLGSLPELRSIVEAAERSPLTERITIAVLQSSTNRVVLVRFM